MLVRYWLLLYILCRLANGPLTAKENAESALADSGDFPQ